MWVFERSQGKVWMGGGNSVRYGEAPLSVCKSTLIGYAE